MQLNYKTFGDSNHSGEHVPIIILHGLLGSLDNWQTIAKKLAEQFQVYIINQRNHGRSPHSDVFSYEILSIDLVDFFEQHQISKAHLIGHSMGGKAAMKFALDFPAKIEKLVVVDIGPWAYPDENNPVFNALITISLNKFTSREEVVIKLRQALNNDETTVQFIMKSLERSEPGQTGFQWKFNLASLWRNYDKISGPVGSSKPFIGKILFIRGEKSDYIKSTDSDRLAALFPNYELEEIKGAGHWVQADKPVEFVEMVKNFLM